MLVELIRFLFTSEQYDSLGMGTNNCSENKGTAL